MLTGPMPLDSLPHRWPSSVQPASHRPTSPSRLPALTLVRGVGALVQTQSLAELHQSLDEIAPQVGLPTWIVQLEDARSIARSRHLTLSNHPAAHPPSGVVQGGWALPAFTARVQQLRSSLAGATTAPLTALGWGRSLVQAVGRGFTVHSRQATSALSLTFYRPGRDGGTPIQPEEVSPDYLMLTQVVHLALLRLLTLAHTAQHGEWLSQRERQCMAWAARGKTAVETALLLHLSEHTVTFHIQRATAKLGASNRSHAVAIAMALGLLQVCDDDAD